MIARWLAIHAALLFISAGPAQTARAQEPEALVKKTGCLACHAMDKKVVGPSFRDIAARYKTEARGFDLSLLSVDAPSKIPEGRKSEVVVALVGPHLHVRVFDAKGQTIVDKSEAKLAKGQDLTELKKRIKSAAAPGGGALAPDTKGKIISDALSVARLSRAREALTEAVTKGSKGNWTSLSKGVPMPPFSERLSDAEVKTLVDWLLSL